MTDADSVGGAGGAEPTDGAGRPRPLGPGWERSQLSLRLTPQRRAELLALCGEADDAPTPTDAVDKALAVATQALEERARGGVDREAVEDAVEAGVAGLRAALAKQASEIELISGSLRGLHRLLSDVLADSGSEDVQANEDGGNPPQDFREWLEAEIDRAEMKAQRVAIARSTWQRRVETGPRFAAVDATAELVAVDGKLVGDAAAYPRLCRLDLLDAGSPICAASFPQPLFLVCQAVPGGWNVHLHRIGSDGQPGEAIGSHRI